MANGNEGVLGQALVTGKFFLLVQPKEEEILAVFL